MFWVPAFAGMTVVGMDKQTRRTEVRAQRRAFVRNLSEAERGKLLIALKERVLSVLPSAGIVASYSAIGDEIDPVSVNQAIGERIALPWFADGDAPMLFRKAMEPLEPGPFHIAQPPVDAPVVEPDILLVPLVAADLARNRLGQGKGHYDRAIALLGRRKPIQAIGLAWDVQIVEQLPADRWDVPLDLVVTPTRILR
jgi:5-formyltetrahydrofolate cyclo-ligase